MTLHEIATNHMETGMVTTYFSNLKCELIHMMSGDYCFYLNIGGKTWYQSYFGPDELADTTWFICDKHGNPTPSDNRKCTGQGRSCSDAASQA